MILPNLVLPSRINQCWDFSGIDSLKECRDKNHFLSYPHNITYSYNSRGFRDQEWPDTIQDLSDAIWCIGDSFTVGVGSPMHHTWPFQLSKIVNQRVINVSMDGASNEWIARTIEKIVQEVNPAKIVVMWSYIHRREHDNILLNDEDRRKQNFTGSNYNDWINFLDCKKRVDLISKSVQFAIPYFRPEYPSIDNDWASIRGPDWPVNAPTSLQELNALPAWILHELKNLHNQLTRLQNKLPRQSPHPMLPAIPDTVIPVKSQDLARDGHHFDLITARWVAAQAANCLFLKLNSKNQTRDQYYLTKID